jgi:hypothetical protein
MTLLLSPVMLDGNSAHNIKAAARLRDAVISQMRPFAECREIRGSAFKDDDNLHIESNFDEGWFDFTYAGTRVRFTVFTGIMFGEAQVKVRCTSEYEIAGNGFSDFLGEFNVDWTGRTNFHEPSGQILATSGAADLIISFYIEKALENNVRIGK